MAAPPVETGAVHEIVDEVFWFDVAVTFDGIPATVEGVAGGEGIELGEVPAAFEAVTVKM